MQSALWTCQYVGCQSSPEQVAALRSRRPEGFPHDEDPSLRVCTVCRRLPLREQAMAGKEDQLDSSFIKGIREELACIEENEKNIQALSQVFRFYAKYAKQLSQVLYDFAVKQCFPWEIIHAMRLVDDVLLMDNSGRYKAELVSRIQGLAVHAFVKVQSESEKREVARMLQAWQVIKIFDAGLIEATRTAIRSKSAKSAHLIDEETELVDEDAELEAEDVSRTTSGKRKREDEARGTSTASTAPAQRSSSNGSRPAVVQEKMASPAKTVSAQNAQAHVERTVQKILNTPPDRPFEMLGIAEDGAKALDIRKAYRRLALIIHPDKNPGLVAKCQEALIKLQAGREQAESDLERLENIVGPSRGETRSEATAAKANDGDNLFTCKYPGCDLPPCKQCANGCCTRNITHCHLAARSKGGQQCFFHPPPRAWARNA